MSSPLRSLSKPLRFSILRLLAAGLLAAGLLAATASGAFAQAAAPALLAKYTFEGVPAFLPDWGAGFAGTYKPATGWRTPFTVRLDKANPHAGEAGLRIEWLEKVPGEKIVHSPSIAIPPAERPGRLTVRFFVRTERLADARVAVRVLERDDQRKSLKVLAGKTDLAPIPAAADWKEVTCEGTLDGRTRSVAVMIVAPAEMEPGALWLDDLSVELTPAR